MKPAFEFIGFLGLSVAAHLAFWQGTADGVLGSAGEEGMASVTLTGGTPALQALVADWDRPPELDPSPVPTGLPEPDVTEPAPELSAAQAKPMAAPPIVPPSSGALPVLPRIDDATPPAPLSRLAPETSPRPKPRRAQSQRPKQQVAANPAPATQKAAGTGGRPVAGQSNKSAASVTNAKPSASLMSRWGGAIRNRIEKRMQHLGGATAKKKPLLWLRVSTSGKVQEAGIDRSSGNPALDSAALAIVRRAALPRAPKGVPAGIYRFALPISFTR